MIGRIFLFLAVNALIILTMTVLMNVFGVKPYLTQYGLDIKSLAIFCLIWGMGGSFISLLMSRAIAKWVDHVQLIAPDTRDPALREIVTTVHDLARKAGLKTMPEVGIYDRPDVNAYATGPTKSMALVAVSTGLLSRMNKAEIEGVLGHEITHIANGDMVTMTLLQGIVNAFVLFLSKLIAFVVARDRDGRPTFMYYVVEIVLQIVFMFFGSMVIAAFSRWREFRADAGSAKIAGKEKMISALQELERTYELMDDAGRAQPATAALQISSKPSGFMKLWATHPPLEERIRRLEESKF